MKTGYLIDMDGVIYRENHLIAGAADFVKAITRPYQPPCRIPRSTSRRDAARASDPAAGGATGAR